MNRSPSTPPSIATLTAQMLGQTENAEVLAAAADALGEVQPHEVAVGFRAEPRLAWQSSLEVLTAFGQKAESVPAPAEWGGLVARQEGAAALPFALANYPQRVRDLGTLLGTDNLADLLPKAASGAPVANGMLKWGTRHVETGTLPHALIAAAAYRAAGDFDRAAEVLASLKGQVGADWQPILANEEAALLWHRGEYARAAKLWAALPDSTPVLFNRGMAALFLGQPAEAKGHLRAAVSALPETSAWHHLASLYLALTELRSE